MSFCAEDRRPSLKPSFIRPPLLLLLPLVWCPSTTLCLPTPRPLQASSFTPLMWFHRHLKPHPSSWPLLSLPLMRRCQQPLALSWPTCSPALWWILALWTLQHTRTCRKPSRLVTCSLMLGKLIKAGSFFIQVLVSNISASLLVTKNSQIPETEFKIDCCISKPTVLWSSTAMNKNIKMLHTEAYPLCCDCTLLIG